MSLNRYVILGAAVGAMGGLMFGFDTAVIAGAEAALTVVYQTLPETKGRSREKLQQELGTA